MTILDPGHDYTLDALDGDAIQRITFVKREGPKYPGNVGRHSGTTIQEVVRALIERCNYVNTQTPCGETVSVIEHLTASLVLLELRAARIHGRRLIATTEEIIAGKDKCTVCGHVGCDMHKAKP